MAERRRRQEGRRQQRRRDPWVTPVAGTSVVVATYNIHKCVGVDRRHDPARIASVLQELSADIICLQEVVAREHGPQPLDHAAFLADATGYHLVTAPAREDHRGRFGNAVLSRFPIVSAHRIDLSIAGHWPRAAVDVDVDAEGRKLRVVATHLGLRGPERRIQTERLLAALEPIAGNDPMLMMGDLNEWRGRRGGIPALDRTFGPAPAPRTFPSWCPILPLDRIYASPPAELVAFEVHRSPLARLASDHLPLRARLAWPD